MATASFEQLDRRPLRDTGRSSLVPVHAPLPGLPPPIGSSVVEEEMGRPLRAPRVVGMWDSFRTRSPEAAANERMKKNRLRQEDGSMEYYWSMWTMDMWLRLWGAARGTSY
eukprot:scaffold17888_cov149-Isochrysis_galbana.AAC.7